jgi:hypothetical protein
MCTQMCGTATAVTTSLNMCRMNANCVCP